MIQCIDNFFQIAVKYSDGFEFSDYRVSQRRPVLGIEDRLSVLSRKNVTVDFTMPMVFLISGNELRSFTVRFNRCDEQ